MPNGGCRNGSGEEAQRSQSQKNVAPDSSQTTTGAVKTKQNNNNNNTTTAFAIRFPKRLQLHQRSSSTRGARVEALLGGTGALPNWAKFRGKRKETLKSNKYLLPRVFHTKCKILSLT